MKLSAYFFYLILALLVASCAGQKKDSGHTVQNSSKKKVDLTILHTNDHHGHFWKNSHGERGMAARKTLIDQLRMEAFKKRSPLLLLSGGDINTGRPESNVLKAEPDFRGMNLLGYDAMAVGNHEFDNPLSVLRWQEKMANFPFLSANIFYKKTPWKRAFTPYIVRSFGNLRVAIFGLTTDDTPIKSNPENLKDLMFVSPIEAAKDLVPHLRTLADIVIAVTHMGHYHNGNHGTNAPGDVSLARAVPGIDVIVGGHSQTVTIQPDRVGNTLIVQAKEWGKYVGKLELTKKHDRWKVVNYRLIPVNLKKKVMKIVDGKKKKVRQLLEKEIPENKEMLNLLSPYYHQAKKSFQKILGLSHGHFRGEKEYIRFKQRPLGQFMGKSVLHACRGDMALLNSGGIRASLNKGPITLGDLLNVHPFSNTIGVVKMTGKDLLAYLKVLGKKSPGDGGYPQTVGIKFKKTKFTVKGKPIDLFANYKVCLVAFNANGGDNWPKVSDLPSYFDTGLDLVYAMKRYISFMNEKGQQIHPAKFQSL